MKIILTVECSCGFKKEYELKPSKRGFFEIPEIYCPNDFNKMVPCIKRENNPEFIKILIEKSKQEKNNGN